MSTATTFDSYAYVRKLRDAGVAEAQAAIQAEALLSLVEDRLATKQDIARYTQEMKEQDACLTTAIKEQDARLTTAMKELDASLTTAMKEQDVRLTTAMKEQDVRLTTAIKELDVRLTTAIKELDLRITTVEANLKRDIKELELRMDSKIHTSKVTIIQWTAAMFTAQAALVIGALFAMLRFNLPAPPPVYHTPPAQEMRLPAPQPAP